MNLVNKINMFNKLAEELVLTKFIKSLSGFENLTTQEFLYSINEIINILNNLILILNEKIKDGDMSYNASIIESSSNLKTYLYNTLISYQTGKDNKEDMLTTGFDLFKTTLSYIRKYLSKQTNYGVVPLNKNTNNIYNQSWDRKV